ncbi:hypothetical protein V495_06250 [Pseudogymnoascus sp. VKM F-4514 (FW-929)]|nr:hypothetical protein V495_06250 [Pseudogymnoascus sp. VKM F-4514 (FW-929)]
MAKNGSAVPDAWDDDWEAQADKEEEGGVKLEQPEEVKLSKAERLAKHAEENKKMWQTAETPETFHFLAAKDTVPLKTEFKPALKVLSRKPASQGAGDGDDDEQQGKKQLSVEEIRAKTQREREEKQKKYEEVRARLFGTDTKSKQLSVEEIRAKTQREREEKQKKYEEVRARLFGTDTKSGSSSPGNVTPPGQGDDRRGGGGRGKGRNRGNGDSIGRAQDIRRPDSSHSGPRELFDPNYTAKPGAVSVARRGNDASSGRSTPNSTRGDREEAQILRTPRGPDAGRGGFGFANRGGKSG